MTQFMTVEDDDSPDNLGVAWDALTSPVYAVYDERGHRCPETFARRLTSDLWLYVDEVDGFRVVPERDLWGLGLTRRDPVRPKY